MHRFKKIFFLSFFFIIYQTSIYAGDPHFLDFKYILNNSEAGKKAQTTLKNKLENGIKNLKDKEKKIQDLNLYIS